MTVSRAARSIRPTAYHAQHMDDLHYVCFADVLGFRSLVSALTHDELDRLYHRRLLPGAEYAVAQGRSRVVQREEGEVLIAETELATLNMLVVSDSVIFWSDSRRCAEFTAILHAARLLLMWGIGAQLPMRLAIAAGHLTSYNASYRSPRLNVRTLYGRGLTDAYDTEQRQQWAGGVVAQSALDLYEGHRVAAHAPTVDGLVAAKMLLRYDVPRHSGTPVTGFAVNWPAANGGSLVSESLIRSAFGRTSTYGPWPESLQQKIDNTLRFAADVGCLGPAV